MPTPPIDGSRPEGTRSPTDHLAQCPPDQLRQAAWELGLALFGYAWSDYVTFVQNQPLAVIIPLLEWLAYYSAAELSTIHSLPALIRAHLNRNRVPQLRRDQRAHLLETVLTINQPTI